ncbi:MAG: hypothetical protein GDA49_09405 [Rhodospirillales bacterium]|nr:hypothetical protein [Rhodospirillales bacterium]
MTEKPHTTADIHREAVFEEHIVARLTADQGYIERASCPSTAGAMAGPETPISPARTGLPGSTAIRPTGRRSSRAMCCST